MNQPLRPYRNRILASLPKEDMARLAPHLRAVDLEIGTTLADGKVSDGYFLEDGIASAVVTLESGETVEVGVIGMDGVVGFPILFGTGPTTGRTFIQIAGSGYRIAGPKLKEEFDRGGALREHLYKYVQGFLIQSAQTAACNRLHNIEERLARWLLSCRERIQSDKLVLTQEFLGEMLGAPRTTVSLATGLLERAGVISHSRGIVTILDRPGLEKKACECYRVVSREFQRLGLL
jgi:CRP-like cAMP-binding protein